MDIEIQLLKEHSKENAHKIVQYISDDTAKFAKLMQLFLNGEYRVVQRAAQVVSQCVEHFPDLITPYHRAVIEYLEKPTHVAVKRNILRLLRFVEIPEKYHGQLIDICFNFILNPKTAIAVRVFSIYVVHEISKKYPEIQSELKMVLENLSSNESPAIKSCIRNVLK